MKKFAFLLVVMFMAFSINAQEDNNEQSEKFEIRPALIVIDVQNEYMKYMCDEDKKVSIEVINGAISYFRHFNYPVLRVYHTDPNWGPKEGSDGFNFLNEVQIKEDDPKFVKNYPSAFKKTDLDKYLKDNNINTVFLCGLSATGCVLATYRGAEDLDYNVFMIKDALLSPKSEHTTMIQEICETVGWRTLALILQASVN